MTEKRERHPNADIIIAWAQGEPIQFKVEDSDWTDWDRGHDVSPGFKYDVLGKLVEWRVASALTPCQERGYAVGDKFLADVSCWKNSEYSEETRFNVIVELQEDDHTGTPAFKILISVHDWAVVGEETYIDLSNVKKIDAEIFK